MFDEVSRRSEIPVISILDVAADYCSSHGFERVGVLGTTATIRRRLYEALLQARGIKTVYSSQSDQDIMMGIIHQELIRGIFLDDSRHFLEAITRKLSLDCDAVILGCTELPLVLEEQSCGTKLVDTTRILARAALDMAIAGGD